MSNFHILVVDDDVLVCKGLKFNLEQAGYKVATASTAHAALELFQRDAFDAAILDIGLPDENGLDLCKTLKSGQDLPIIFLTARRRELDEIVGLEVGADDYIIKPFSVDVLLAHLRAVLRRGSKSPTEPRRTEMPLQVGPFELNPVTHTARKNGSDLELAPREFELLHMFMSHPERAFTSEELVEGVWGVEFIGEPQVLYVQVRSLRMKIEKDSSNPDHILTLRGLGINSCREKTPGIRTYLILSHGLLLTISLVAIGFIWSHSEYQVVTQELQKLMSERATLLSNIVAHELAESRGLEFRGVDSTNIPLERDMTAVYIDLTGFPYELTPGSVSSQDSELLLELNSKYHVSHGNITTLLVMDNGSSSVYAASPVFDSQAQQVGTVCLLLPIGYLDGYITRLRWLLAGVVIVVTLLSVGVSTLLTNYFSRHFSRAQELAATVANGDYHLRIPESGPDELRNLSHYLNHMAEELQEQLKMRQTLLANVAHELARPLAGLQLGIESLRKGAVRDPDLSDELLVNMQQTVQRLSSLVDDITLSALPKTKPLELHRQLIDVEPFLKGLSTRFLPLAEARGLRLEVRVEAGLPPINIDEKRVHQIVGNLMDNAIKFTPHGGVIRLSAERAGEHQVLIAIHDSGSGIDPKELENIFEPFYQGDIGRRVKQGMGLGLAIAHQLAVAHGGDLFLKNHQDGGVIAVLTLPIDFP